VVARRIHPLPGFRIAPPEFRYEFVGKIAEAQLRERYRCKQIGLLDALCRGYELGV